MFIYLLKYWLNLLCLQLYRKVQKKNVIKLVPMNPDVSLAKKMY